jgi:hypothetical protein
VTERRKCTLDFRLTLTLSIDKGTAVVLTVDADASKRGEAWSTNLEAAFDVAAANSSLKIFIQEKTDNV